MDREIEKTRRVSSKKIIVIKTILVLVILALFLVLLVLSVGKGT